MPDFQKTTLRTAISESSTYAEPHLAAELLFEGTPTESRFMRMNVTTSPEVIDMAQFTGGVGMGLIVKNNDLTQTVQVSMSDEADSVNRIHTIPPGEFIKVAGFNADNDPTVGTVAGTALVDLWFYQ